MRLKVVSAVRQVERFVDQRKVRNDVADHRMLEHRPVLPRRVVRMAAADRCRRRRCRARPAPGRASLRRSPERQPPARVGRRDVRRRRRRRAARRRSRAISRSDSSDLVEAHRDARRDIAVAARRRSHASARRRARTANRQRRSRAWPLARAREPEQPELGRELGAYAARRRETVLQARVLVVDAAAARAISRAMRSRFVAHRMHVLGREVDAQRRPARRRPSGSDGRTPRRSRATTSSLSRENCASPKAKPPSLPSAPRSPR